MRRLQVLLRVGHGGPDNSARLPQVDKFANGVTTPIDEMGNYNFQCKPVAIAK